MKVAAIFLLSALALLNLSGNARAEVSGTQAKCNSNVNGCTKIYNPVCGTDGQTYPNECQLCMDNKVREIPVLIKKYGPC